MPTFQLFRAQAHIYSPGLPFEAHPALFTPDSALKAAITEQPSQELRRGHIWHIGNLRQIDSSGWYLAVGRTTRSTVQVFDDQTKQFVESELENAPFTHVLIDTSLGASAVAEKARLARDATGIARQLERLLNGTTVARRGHVVFDFAPVSDPQVFVRRLRESHAVKRFTFAFGLPNAWDVDRLIVRPAQHAAQELRAQKGSATFNGDALDKSRLEELARSTATTGHEASATIQSSPDAEPERIRLSRDAVLFRTEGDTESLGQQALASLRRRYNDIRSLF